MIRVAFASLVRDDMTCIYIACEGFPLKHKIGFWVLTRPNPISGVRAREHRQLACPIIGDNGELTPRFHPEIYALTIPESATGLTVSLANTDLPGAARQNLITLSVTLSGGSHDQGCPSFPGSGSCPRTGPEAKPSCKSNQEA
jgi:hypothetical protein